jgi:ribosome biogenesis protein Nip4
MRSLNEFLEAVGAKHGYDEETLLKINTKRFSVGEELGDFVLDRRQLVYAGRYLGKTRREFLPSSILLDELSHVEGLSMVNVDAETAWLFVCGRDIFQEKIVLAEGEFREGKAFLVVFEGNCLGYGVVEPFEGRLILRNVFDLGDFLRRERQGS